MDHKDQLRNKIIGLGAHSFKKSYYPELQNKLNELNLFKLALDQASEMFVLFSPFTGDVLYYNNSAHTFFKLKPNENTTLQKLTSEVFWEKIQKCLKEKNENQWVLYESILVDEVERILEINLSHVQGKENQFGLVLLRDKTESVKAQIELEESERRYRSIVENINDGMFIFNFSGKILDYNKKAIELSGYAAEDFDLLNIKDVIKVGSFDSDFLQLSAYQDLVLEGILIQKKSFEINVSISSSLVSGKGNGIIQCFIRDISLQKEVENQLIEAKNRAEESDRLKSAFLSNMSHEIRTPMNGIVGFASLLEEEDLEEEEKKQYTQLIIKSSGDLLRLINDILDISKIESGSVELLLRPLNIHSFIQEIYHLFQSKIAAEGKIIDFQCSLDGILPKFTMQTDELRLKQILVNLLDNALKFTSSGFIKFGCLKKEDDVVQFFVKDSGVGIPQSKQSLIFDRFRQSDESITKNYGGTGLGLSICQGLTDLMNGHIWLESKEGVGTSFFVDLPVEP